MRHTILMSLGLCASLLVAACEKAGDANVDRALESVNAIDEANLSDIMLTIADPNESVAYFSRTLSEKPDRIDIMRGLAISLIRAKRHTEAVSAWRRVVKHPDSTSNDRVDLADALIRSGNWEDADAELDQVAPTHETFKRYRLEAMVADSAKEWKKADSFYETAVGLTTRPSGVLNNWGYSKLTRGDFTAAERLFLDAIKQDTSLFTAKNNLVLARAAQRNYSLPVIPLEQTEKAQLLHTMALSAIKQSDVEIGKALLREAIDTHPQHFETAVRSLRALEAT
ncbi:tetratricopeptide repeat protein [Cognatishimia sp. 1_MG-2023]|uniref:tetratricopeptide repeat protein n=1 Tax=Cognatishimia sp. 1_MG-2023 TaxID=3062642 RepID=UPI0026E1CCFB|nr:tetratricopeptide repeat protein [Cognatishimia sp. 1_MG-2023]MDO6725991.1 tetratricopeptide repeat protein [Cognatishimia sp. 1_MG-2023]